MSAVRHEAVTMTADSARCAHAIAHYWEVKLPGMTLRHTTPVELNPDDVLVEVCTRCGESWRDGERTGRQPRSDREARAASRARHPSGQTFDGQLTLAVPERGDGTSQGDPEK